MAATADVKALREAIDAHQRAGVWAVDALYPAWLAYMNVLEQAHEEAVKRQWAGFDRLNRRAV